MDYSYLIAKKDAEFNEEQTKHALVLPMLDRILGWDIYDSLRLIPEFTADTPGKNGEKVDYALDLQGDGHPEVLIEVKAIGSRLNSRAAAQLYRYFGMTEAKIGILTDGYRWMLYSDLDKPNVMDDEPFLDFDLEDLSTRKPLEKLFSYLSYSNFDAGYLRAWGEVARDTERLRDLVKRELANPSDDFSKYFFSNLHPGSRATTNRLEAFKSMLIEVLNERDNENLRVDALEFKTKSSDVPVKITRPRRTGYFLSDQGHRGIEGNLKHSWVSFWTEVAKDTILREKLLEVAVNEDPKLFPKGIVLIESTSFSDPIGYGLYIASNLSSERRLVLLERLASSIGIIAEVVYTDEEGDSE